MSKLSRAIWPASALFIYLLLISSIVSAKGTFGDISFPRPKGIPLWNQPAEWRIGKDVVRMTSILRIDEKGIVINAEPADTLQKALFASVEKYLRTLTFFPFSVDGSKRPGVALAQVIFRPEVGWFDLEFGLDSSGAITDDRLYDSLTYLNGCAIPKLGVFPSFFSRVSWKDRFDTEPYILFKISADSTGSITDAVPVKSTMPTLTSQLQTALRWAKLIPPKSEGKRLAAKSYLAVLFFPGNAYPTRPFFADSVATKGTILDRSQLRFIPDSAKYMALPIPKNPPYDSLYLKDQRKSTEMAKVTTVVWISREGKAGFNFPPGLSADSRAQLRDLSAKLKFYPALDFSGQPVEFFGTIQFEFTDSTLVRIKCDWLSALY